MRCTKPQRMPSGLGCSRPAANRFDTLGGTIGGCDCTGLGATRHDFQRWAEFDIRIRLPCHRGRPGRGGARRQSHKNNPEKLVGTTSNPTHHREAGSIVCRVNVFAASRRYSPWAGWNRRRAGSGVYPSRRRHSTLVYRRQRTERDTKFGTVPQPRYRFLVSPTDCSHRSAHAVRTEGEPPQPRTIFANLLKLRNRTF
jgi:hypothetical protein